jgi:hypothetical protein
MSSRRASLYKSRQWKSELRQRLTNDLTRNSFAQFQTRKAKSAGSHRQQTGGGLLSFVIRNSPQHASIVQHVTLVLVSSESSRILINATTEYSPAAIFPPR